MSQETFARVEKKYVISREQYEWIRQFLAEYTVEDEYGQSTIRNVYYDTPGEEDHSVIPSRSRSLRRKCASGDMGKSDETITCLWN